MFDSPFRKAHETNKSSAAADSALRELRRIVLSKGSRAQKLRQVAETLRASGGYRWVGLYDVERHRGVVSNVVWVGPGAPQYPEFPINKGLTGRAIQTGSTVNAGDVTMDSDYLTALGTTKSEIILPVIDDQGSVVGTVDVESEIHNAFGPEVQRFLERCAEVVRPLWGGRLER
jgi:L-methionine (R)-S-oxide reductase